jgi:hypothetical protein
MLPYIFLSSKKKPLRTNTQGNHSLRDVTEYALRTAMAGSSEGSRESAIASTYRKLWMDREGTNKLKRNR